MPRIGVLAPRLQRLLHEGMTEGLLAQLRAGELDVVVCAAPIALAGLQATPLDDEPMLAAASSPAKAAPSDCSAARTRPWSALIWSAATPPCAKTCSRRSKRRGRPAGTRCVGDYSAGGSQGQVHLNWHRSKSTSVPWLAM